jgi:hypothetical protein
LSASVAKRDGGARELLSRVAVGKAVERMLAAEQGLEERAVVARERVEGADRKIALKFLIAIKGGMDLRQWAQLHPAEWARLIEIAPLKRRDSQPTWKRR